jgi:hypothetical protein
MVHGKLDLAWTKQGGPRGASEGFFGSMLMASGERDVGPGSLLQRAMTSAEPLLGPEGYPLLLQTGEIDDLNQPLVDRQHPHDLVMELAAAYRLPLGSRARVFVYGGLPGEPALGPAAFMHRASATPNPVAPISHHWLDATHISFGVLSLGASFAGHKLDASVFNGREPDAARWGFETGTLDSRSARLTWNPSAAWSLQASYGRLRAPESLHPDVDVDRTTFSAQWSAQLGHLHLDALLAVGRNRRSAPLSRSPFSSYPPQQALEAALFEWALDWGGPERAFLRAEWVEKDELFSRSDAFHARAFPVSKLDLGLRRDLPGGLPAAPALGAAFSVHRLPEFLEPDYGRHPKGFTAFLSFSLR